jgi:hypothetical protein
LGLLSLGLTPVQLEGVPVGRHEVRLSKDGYAEKNIAIDLTAGGHTVLEIPMERPDEFRRGRIRPGVELGLSYVFLAYSLDVATNLIDDRGQLRFSAGAFVDLAITPNVFFSPGLRYARPGNKNT